MKQVLPRLVKPARPRCTPVACTAAYGVYAVACTVVSNAHCVVSSNVSLVAPAEEVMHDGHRVRQALHAAVHGADVAQIGQAC